MNRYICFFKFSDNVDSEDRDYLTNLIKEKLENDKMKTIIIFGQSDIKIFDQETGCVIEI